MKKYVRSRKYVYTAMALATMATLATAVPVWADDSVQGNISTTIDGNSAGKGMMRRGMMRPAVFGTVTAINGDTITVAGKKGFGPNATDVTYTVDASNAKIMKNKVAATISNIAVGDMIVAQGTLNGTNVAATMIRDGKMPPRAAKQELSTNITGTGEPIVAGSVASINGSHLTITNKSSVTYNIDASNAKVTKGPNTSSISDIAVGDMVIVQGTVNGHDVVASSVIDQARLTNSNNSDDTGTGTNPPKPHEGFFGGIGAFFSHIFGF